MHSCEIMLKDIADSKRINTNIKASSAGSMGASAIPEIHELSTGQLAVKRDPVAYPSRPPIGLQSSVPSHVGEPEQAEPIRGLEAGALPLDIVDASIISALFWPPFQVKANHAQAVGWEPSILIAIVIAR